MALSPSFIRLLIILFVALGSTTYGYSSSIIATTLGQPSFISYFGLDTSPSANDLMGAINGLFQAGGFIGTLISSPLADHFGRRVALLITCIICIIGGGLQAGSVHISMYLVMRFVTGVGIGSIVTLVPLYQCEIAPPRIRGLLVGMHGALLGFGYCIASYIGLGFYFVDAGGAQWRVPLAIQCLFPLVLALGIMFVPETPRWLLLKGREEEAYLAFKAVRAESSDTILGDEDAIRAEFSLLKRQTQHEKENELTYMDMMRLPSMRKRCIVGFLTTFGAQTTATIVINNYGPLLYKSLGFGTLQQLLMACGWITIAPFGNLINALVVDKFGRVHMLLFGLISCVVALIGECITVSIFQNTGIKAAAVGAVFFLYMHVTVFTLSVDATSYVYISEIFPTPVRAKGMGISVSGLFFATIIFTSAAPTAFADIGWKYYLVFAILTSIIAAIIFFWFPETSGISLEEVQARFGDSVEGLDGVEPFESEKNFETKENATATVKSKDSSSIE